MRVSRSTDRERVSAYVSAEVKRSIEEAAEREDRSVSSYVGRLLRKQVEIEQRVFGADERQPHTTAVT